MERAIPILPVTDLDVAKAFYVDGLGFSVRFDVRTGEADDASSGLLGVELGTMVITLDCPMSGHGRDACVSLEVADADRYYHQWRERVDIARAPQNESWGARTFSVHDPFGNTIFVMGPTTDEELQ